MRFNYSARTSEGKATEGTIEAPSAELALAALQRRSFIVTRISPEGSAGEFLTRQLGVLQRVSSRDVVILSRQLSTLFQAKVPVVDSLKVLVSETQNPALKKSLSKILEDIQGGASISQAISRHPKIFSRFFVSMVRSGEESGKLEEVFTFLADSLERSHELTSKARNAMLYPAFILFAFVGVIILMMTVVIPRLGSVLTETGQELPLYTKIVLGTSDFLTNYGIFVLGLLILFSVFAWRYIQGSGGKFYLSKLQISIPVFGTLYKKFYISRMADSLQTLISGGVSLVRSLEITADIVGNEAYKRMLLASLEAVKSGSTLADAFADYEDIPPLVTAMVRIGEGTGKLDFILDNMARFYRKEVESAVESLVGLIEPVLIVVLGLSVAMLVASILVPIYNMSATL